MTKTQIVELVAKPSTLPPFWICYWCNLTFHDESIASLHKEISNHNIINKSEVA